jgi:hypothetical protein
MLSAIKYLDDLQWSLLAAVVGTEIDPTKDSVKISTDCFDINGSKTLASDIDITANRPDCVTEALRQVREILQSESQDNDRDEGVDMMQLSEWARTADDDDLRGVLSVAFEMDFYDHNFSKLAVDVKDEEKGCYVSLEKGRSTRLMLMRNTPDDVSKDYARFRLDKDEPVGRQDETDAHKPPP